MGHKVVAHVVWVSTLVFVLLGKISPANWRKKLFIAIGGRITYWEVAGTDSSNSVSIHKVLLIAVMSLITKFARIIDKNFISVVIVGIVGGTMAAKV